MALPEYYTCEMHERPPRARLLQALRHFDWIELSHLTVVVLGELDRTKQNTLTVAMSKMVDDSLVDIDRSTKPFRYRLRRSSMADVDTKLASLRVQLFTAMQMLAGDDQLKFKQLLFDVVQCMDDPDEFLRRVGSHEPFVTEP